MAESENENLNIELPQISVPSETSDTSVAEVAKSKYKKNKVKKGFYYSFLTIVLIFCIVQVGSGAILNISKTISYKAKINTLEKLRDEAEARNYELKDGIKQFSSTASLEEIARNNLKMAGENEVLVIINKSEPKETEEQNKKKK